MCVCAIPFSDISTPATYFYLHALRSDEVESNMGRRTVVGERWWRKIAFYLRFAFFFYTLYILYVLGMGSILCNMHFIRCFN